MSPALLAEYPVARTTSPGALRDAVDGLTGYGHTVVGKAPAAGTGALHGTVNGVRIGGLSLVFVAYATRVSVLAPPTRDQVVLVVPLGPMWVEVAGRAQRMVEPFVLSASADTLMRPDPRAGALVGAVAHSEVAGLFREAFGGDREYAVNLAQDRAIPVHAAPALRRGWQDFAAHPAPDPAAVLDRLLIGLAPYTRGIEAGPGGPPAYLIHAVRHLRRHLAEPLSLAELGGIVGIGSRQLQLAFQAHLGRTAQEVVRDARLDRAWTLLRAGSGTDARRVADVAAEVGIPHSGRFSQYFFARYGVHPSALRT